MLEEAEYSLLVRNKQTVIFQMAGKTVYNNVCHNVTMLVMFRNICRFYLDRAKQDTVSLNDIAAKVAR